MNRRYEKKYNHLYSCELITDGYALTGNCCPLCEYGILFHMYVLCKQAVIAEYERETHKRAWLLPLHIFVMMNYPMITTGKVRWQVPKQAL